MLANAWAILRNIYMKLIISTEVRKIMKLEMFWTHPVVKTPLIIVRIGQEVK